MRNSDSLSPGDFVTVQCSAVYKHWHPKEKPMARAGGLIDRVTLDSYGQRDHIFVVLSVIEVASSPETIKSYLVTLLTGAELGGQICYAWKDSLDSITRDYVDRD